MKKIKFVDLVRENRKYKQDILASVEKIIDSGEYIRGDHVTSLEKEFAVFCDSKYAYGLNNGTDSLIMGIKALNLPTESEIIVPSLTFPATIQAIIECGHIPVFADVSETLNISTESITSLITSKTKALIIVHWTGLIAEMDIISEICKNNNIIIIEDAAQAHGAVYKGKTAGSFGKFAAFSFHATKTISVIGNGGMLVTNDEEIYNKVDLLANFGRAGREKFICYGRNSRIDEVNAATALIKLRDIENLNRKRIYVAERYNQELTKKIITPMVPEYCKHVYHLYCIRIPQRNKIMNYLKEKGVDTVPHYSIPCHKQKAFKSFNKNLLVNTDKFSNELLSLPINVNDQEQDYVITTLNDAINKFI